MNATAAALNREPLLDVQGVCKSFRKPDGDQLVVLEQVNLTLRPGEIVGLLGRSGSGKSTLLRAIAGLDECTGGQVNYLGQRVSGPARGIAMVFQSFALFPWLTVLENVQLGLEAQGVPEPEMRKRALANFRFGQAKRLEPELHVLQHRQPRKQREALEHHGDAGRRPGDRMAAVIHLAGNRLRQARDQSQQRRLARSGAAEQTDDFAFLQRQIDVVEDQQVFAVGLRERLTARLNLQQCVAHDPDLYPSRNFCSAYQ